MVSLLSKEELLSAVKGSVIGKSNAKGVFAAVETDSRNIEENSNSMFIPLVGEFQDGHKYISAVLEKSVSVVLLNNSEYDKHPDFYINLSNQYPETLFVKVENTLHGLQDVAEKYVSKWNPEMIKISITGSCGKTTTKEMMVSVCKAAFGESEVAYTKGNFNSETGLPLSVLRCKGTEKVGIFEMGMNRENEIGEISKVFKSDYGIITNIGTAHIGLLGSRENIAREKRKSLDYISKNGAAFIPVTDDFADFCTENVDGKVVKYGIEVPAEKSGVSFIKENGLFGSIFTLDNIEIHLPISGMYNFQNALGVIACAKEIGISAEKIKLGLENLGAVKGRMEVSKVKINGKNITLVNDCYNANPDSMKKSIELIGNSVTKGKKILVLADMKELGEKSLEEHKAIGKLLNKTNVDLVFLVGEEIQPAFDEYKGDGKVFWFEEKSEENFCEIIDEIKKNINEEDVILFKGSHSMNLDKIASKIVDGGNE